MRITKAFFGVAAVGLALMGFASSVSAATDGVVRDVTTNGIIPENRELHFVGWIRTDNMDSLKCHMTMTFKATGTAGNTGSITNFTFTTPFNCTFSGALSGCALTSSTTESLPSHVTVTPPGEGIPGGDLDVTGSVVFTQTYSGLLCPFAPKNKDMSVSLGSLTLKPLKTGSGGTNTPKLGGTAGTSEPIAGFELSGVGAFRKSGEEGETLITMSGQLELAEADRCTWKIAGS